MYQPNSTNNNPAILKDSLTLVQSAILDYKAATGVLPIQNFDETTPLYEQCVIDFKKMVDSGVLGEIPSSSFERGGTNYFVILNPDDAPTVKLLDLVSLQTVNDVQDKVTRYQGNHRGAVPNANAIVPGWYSIDYEKLSMNEPTVLSPYSKQPTQLFVSLSGHVIVDYSADVMKAKDLANVKNPKSNLDLRTLLIDQSYFVPARSTAYYWRNNQLELALQ
jgi:hypothetical protein